MLRLRTFGSIDLRSEDGAVRSVLSQPVRVALLAYLAVERPRGPHRRDVLTHLLWPGRDEAAARRNLRQILYRLRQSLGDDVIAGHGEQSVGLAPGTLRCDAVAFEEALEEGRTADAMELYQGPFLQGLHVPGAGEFERWADRQRDRFARRAEDAAWSLAEDAEAEGDVRGAERWTRRALDLNPFEERGWRRLMELLDRHGERAGAVRAYEELATRLEEELGVEPSPETRETAERIRTRQGTSGPDGGAPEETDGGGADPDGGDGRAASGGPPAEAGTTIAVLPFLDLSPGGGQEHFGDGLSEELTTTLGRLDGLRVVARTSAFAFRGEERDVREIGEALGTTALVEGSVRIE
ncbi:MAG: BTAD domain-containing putative transcriptional regulator, partial [Acidobacteriota bacterium]